MRVGLSIWPGYEPLILGEARGDFQDQNIRIVEYSSATQVLRAYRNGNIEVAAITLDEMLLLRQEIPDLSVIAVLDISHGADVVLGQRHITQLSDLKGKRVGYESTALGAFVLDRALESAGLTASDITTVHVELDRHEEVFLKGDVDGLVTYEPKSTRLRAQGAIQLFDSREIPGEIMDVLVTRRATVESHLDSLVPLIRAWMTSIDYIRRDPEGSNRVLSAQFGISEVDMRDIYSRILLADEAKNRELLEGDSPSLETTAKKLAESMVQHGLVTRPVDTTNLTDTRPLSAYLSRSRD